MSVPVSRLLNVLVAVDGSEHSLASIALLRDLPLHPESSITAVAVLDVPNTPRHYMLLAALDQAESLLKETGLEVHTGLLHGHIASSLVQYANEHHPDLILLGAKGLRATLGILLGGVAQQVVEHAGWPVLVMRPPYVALRKVLLLVDGSIHSQSALQYVARFPFPPGCQVEVMHVLAPPVPDSVELYTYPWVAAGDMPPVWRRPPEPGPENSQTVYAAGQALLDQMVDTLREKGIPASSVLRQGDAATQALAHVEENRVDMVVCGSRGLGAVRGWFLGSFSRKLVHYATCSVLVVRSETED
jgi:nucleotide-binding universal stress UspA family protein